MEKTRTTINISNGLWVILNSMKKESSDTYEDVIWRLIAMEKVNDTTEKLQEEFK